MQQHEVLVVKCDEDFTVPKSTGIRHLVHTLIFNETSRPALDLRKNKHSQNTLLLLVHALYSKVSSCNCVKVAKSNVAI